MAATAILRPQDCLNNTFHYERNPNPQPKAPRRHHRKRSPVGRNQGPDPRLRAKNLVMGQVKILKRGEDLVAGPTDRLGPEPETVQKQIRVSGSNLYAGSAVSLASPPPSELPVPAFFSKKKENRDDAASGDLRRLLRLDLV